MKDILAQHLKTSADGFIWAMEQMPTGRLYTLPPPTLGGWPAARLLSHITWYEREIALPVMRMWLGETFETAQITEEGMEAAWQHDCKLDLPALLANFRQGRDAQLVLLDDFPADAWDKIMEDTIWEYPVPLRWVVMKTYQHTLEHTDSVMKLVLFWDMELQK